MDKKEFKDMDIVVCGHSLGGAIASIVAIKLFIISKQCSQNRSMKCITFGAPLIGDRVFQRNIPEEMLLDIHHFLCVDDPLPKLLWYTQCASPWLQNSKDLKELYRNIIKDIDEARTREETSCKSCETSGSAIDSNFGVKFTLFEKVTKLAEDEVIVPGFIGNFHILTENLVGKSFFSWNRLKESEQYIELKCQFLSKKNVPDSHALSHYKNCIYKMRRMTSAKSSLEMLKYQQYSDPSKELKLPFINPFKPLIYSADLAKSKGEKSFLKLTFTGKYIHNVVLDLCQFHFSFPFAKIKEKVKIKRLSMGKYIERLVIEEEMEDVSITIKDHGIELLLVTQFGEYKKILRPENVRDMVVDSVCKIAENDSVWLIVRRAIQRGMALKKNKTQHGCNSSEQIIDEIRQLGTVAIGEDQMKKKETEIFTEYVKNIDYVFSNEASFQNVKDFSNKIEKYIRTPLHIKACWTTIENTAVNFLAAPDAVISGFIASPHLSIIGIAQVMSTGLVTAVPFLNNDQLTDCNYKNTLNFIVQELLEAQQESLDSTAKAEITDLMDKDNFFSIEKALIRLASNKMLKTKIYENCIISESLKNSKEEIENRIKVIQSIHRIREIFSQQCFIGVAGLQDAGKTTLIKNIWNVGDKPGYFDHTRHPELYQITRKLLVVDFPASNSLHYYSKTFSICGEINNLVIVVIPFSGDVSEILTKEIAEVFRVMRGSNSVKVVLCINKCCLYVNKLRNSLLKNIQNDLKQIFTKQMNDHYERNGQSICLENTDIFFTDWELGDSSMPNSYGIVGIEKIKDIIKDYLVSNGIYNMLDTDELDRCLSYVSK